MKARIQWAGEAMFLGESVQLNRRTMKVDVILRRSYQDCDPVLSLGPVLSWRPLPAGV